MKYAVSNLSYEANLQSIYYELNSHPKNMVPVFDNSHDVMFWVDENIASCPERTEKDYGWLTESEAIVPNIYNFFYSNMPSILDSLNLVFTHKRSLTSLDDRIKWAPASSCWIVEPKIHEKNKLVSMISSSKMMCQGHVKRMNYVEKFKDSLDLYGRNFKPIHRKDEGLADYMFSIAIENNVCGGYFTEKILDCFATGTIPVYLGDPQLSLEFNMDGVIILDDEFSIEDLNEDLYYKKMDAIVDNFNRLNKFYRIEDYIYENYLVER